MKTKRSTQLDYCPYLLVSGIDYSLTNYADHRESQVNHDAISRYLQEVRLTSWLVWRHEYTQLSASPHGYVLFVDTMLDKNFSHQIELARLQYSGNALGVIKGIGPVNGADIKPETGQNWATDYRIDDSDCDSKCKLDHVEDMLTQVVQHKQLSLHKDNRLVDDSGDQEPYCRVDELAWIIENYLTT